MSEHHILGKAMDFAVRIVNMYKYLCNEKKEYVMSKQVLRSGTSIGANLHEVYYGQSDNDFLAKMYISLKETAETDYWITLLMKTDFIEVRYGNDIKTDCEAIRKIISSIILSKKETMQEKEAIKGKRSYNGK